MCVLRYRREEYVILQADDCIIVYNTEKPFERGHTHLKSLKSGIDAINFVIHKKIPKRTSKYYLKSLIRISKDDNYICQINQLLQTRHDKGEKPKPIKKPGGGTKK